MLKIIWLLLSLGLIVLVFLRAPQNSGLASFATKTDILGSPSSAEKFLNNLTGILILGYLILAIQLNFLNLNN
jgi:protein translocase SecG subunit